MKLKDKVAIVTGGAQGLGEGIARLYVAEGANVAVADLNLDEAKVAMRGAAEAAGLADEGAGDDAADIVGVGELAGDPAQSVEPLEPEPLFVRGELQDAVGRGVEDRLPGREMLGAELLDDDSTRGGAVAEQPGQPAACDQRLGQRRLINTARSGPIEVAWHDGGPLFGHPVELHQHNDVIAGMQARLVALRD